MRHQARTSSQPCTSHPYPSRRCFAPHCVASTYLQRVSSHRHLDIRLAVDPPPLITVHVYMLVARPLCQSSSKFAVLGGQRRREYASRCSPPHGINVSASLNYTSRYQRLVLLYYFNLPTSLLPLLPLSLPPSTFTPSNSLPFSFRNPLLCTWRHPSL